MPTEVWMHLRNGELWMATLKRLFFFLPLARRPDVCSEPVLSGSWPEEASYSASASVMMLAILAPSVRACSHPP